jgi:hypothetical protein
MEHFPGGDDRGLALDGVIGVGPDPPPACFRPARGVTRPSWYSEVRRSLIEQAPALPPDPQQVSSSRARAVQCINPGGPQTD